MCVFVRCVCVCVCKVCVCVCEVSVCVCVCEVCVLVRCERVFAGLVWRNEAEAGRAV